MIPYIDQDPVDSVFALLARREKQLKRVIESARAWMWTARDYEDCANQTTEAYLGLPPGPEDCTDSVPE